MFHREISKVITLTISTAWHFATPSGGIGFFLVSRFLRLPAIHRDRQALAGCFPLAQPPLALRSSTVCPRMLGVLSSGAVPKSASVRGAGLAPGCRRYTR
jgi:hypothetical protein